MKKFLSIIMLLLFSGCDDENSCSIGERECEGNLFRSCVYGEWREILCQNNAPICDPERGCQEAVSLCGNDKIDSGEECDGTAVHGRTCQGMNASLVGTPVCRNCHLDYTVCTVQTCKPGETRCNGEVLENCTDNGYQPLVDCGALELACDPEQKTCVKGQ